VITSVFRCLIKVHDIKTKLTWAVMLIINIKIMSYNISKQ